MNIDEIVKMIKNNLSPDLLKKGQTGHCYVASEVLYHMIGQDEGFKPMRMQWEGSSHWFLQKKDKFDVTDYYQGDNDTTDRPIPTMSIVLDITAEQFKKTPLHHLAKGCGFHTKELSNRGRTLLDRILIDQMVKGPDEEKKNIKDVWETQKKILKKEGHTKKEFKYLFFAFLIEYISSDTQVA